MTEALFEIGELVEVFDFKSGYTEMTIDFNKSLGYGIVTRRSYSKLSEYWGYVILLQRTLKDEFADERQLKKT